MFTLGCHSGEIEQLDRTAVVERSEPIEQAPAVAPPEPTPAPEPEPEPAPKPMRWQPVAAPAPNVDKELRRTATSARFALEHDELRYRLDLRLREQSTKVTLTDRNTGHTLVREWSGSCNHEYEVIGASLTELARDADGRKLLELWLSCRLGEDIHFTDSLVLIVVADASGLEPLWSGNAIAHTSHVCGAWERFDATFVHGELIVTKSDHARIWEPEYIPGYDCDEDTREYTIVREHHRIALP